MASASQEQTIGVRRRLAWWICSLALTLALGIVLGNVMRWWYWNHQLRSPAPYRALRQSNANYQFINPLLGCDFFSEKPYFRELEPLPQEVAQLVAGVLNRKEITTSSVYFRELNTGRWLGYNEDVKYFPASLLKVSLMISFLKQAESDPQLLARQLRYDPKVNLNLLEKISPAEQLQRGRYYTVEQLIEHMIIFSDNKALQLLMDNINQDVVDQSFGDLSIALPEGGSEVTDFLSPKSYSIFLRILYNSTYLNRGMSEKALQLLTRTEFTDGLGRGVPASVKIAHKFGEYGNIDPQTNKITYHELHDCGIIYYPQHPYLLCVMTRGADLEKLKGVIGNISKLFYSYFVQRYPQ